MFPAVAPPDAMILMWSAPSATSCRTVARIASSPSATPLHQ